MSLKVLEKSIFFFAFLHYYPYIQFGTQILTCNQGPPLKVYNLTEGRRTLLNNLLNYPNTVFHLDSDAPKISQYTINKNLLLCFQTFTFF